MSMKRQAGFLISKIHRLSGRIFARMLKSYNIELNPAQGRIMFVLWQTDGIPIHELAERTSLGKSTLTSMLDRLQATGYIERVRSEADRRIILVRRTAKDRAAQQAYERVSQAMTDIYYCNFSESEMDQFERLLERVLNNLGAHDPSPSP
ncbi:MarR family winged helix-turn-helix transcriptional regulator [Candidatus Bipolaricaulota bacterium]|nr:MarR family winged helix-turn-helix transcriptional regulator [Candidatus Bipolaricaulota bacterium]